MTKKASPNRPPKYEWKGHIPVYFNDPEIAQCLEFVDQRPWDFEDVIVQIIQSGFGVKFTYDEHNDSCMVTLQTKDRNHDLYGYTLGFMHQDLSRLFQIAYYIVFVLVENGSITKPQKGNAPTW